MIVTLDVTDDPDDPDSVSFKYNQKIAGTHTHTHTHTYTHTHTHTYREIGFNKLNSGIKNGTEVTFWKFLKIFWKLYQMLLVILIMKIMFPINNCY